MANLELADPSLDLTLVKTETGELVEVNDYNPLDEQPIVIPLMEMDPTVTYVKQEDDYTTPDHLSNIGSHQIQATKNTPAAECSVKMISFWGNEPPRLIVRGEFEAPQAVVRQLQPPTFLVNPPENNASKLGECQENNQERREIVTTKSKKPQEQPQPPTGLVDPLEKKASKLGACQENNQERRETATTKSKKPQDLPNVPSKKQKIDEPKMPGLRLLDIGHFLSQIRQEKHDSIFSCGFSQLVFVKEFSKDGVPAIRMKCKMCEIVSDLTYRPPEISEN